MVSVVFKVQGGCDVGMGHVYRSLCLADTLAEYGMVVDSFFCNPDPVSLQFIESRGYRARAYMTNNPTDDEALLQHLSENMTGALVLDQPVSDPAFLERLESSGVNLFVAALDYVDMEEDRLDLIVNLYNHHPYLQVPCSENVAYVEGPSYAIIRPAFASYCARPKTIRKHARDVLVSFGGGDSRGNTVRVLDAVADLKNQDMCFHVVIGPNFVDKEAIRQKAGGVPGIVRIYESVMNIEELMFSCDFGLHGGGTMMLEMASVGTPSIVLPQNENEVRFGGFFVKQDVAKMPGYVNELREGQLAAIITELASDATERRRMSRVGKALVDGKGRCRIANLIRKGIGEAECRDFLL